MKRSVLIAAGLCLSATAAAAAPCDVIYEIQPGDTLSEISRVAYGFTNYQIIYSRNLSVLNSLVDLPVGQEIIIPCLTGELSQSPDAVALTFRMLPLDAFQSEDPPAAPEPAPEPDAVAEAEAPPAPQGPVALLTANSPGALADEAMVDGGMIPAIAKTAMATAGAARGDLNLTFVNDRASHVRALMPRGDYALALPWRQPVCERAELLTRTETALCQRYAFSASLYEEVLGVFFRAEETPSPEAGHAGLEGMRICAPVEVGFGALAQQNVALTIANLLRVNTMTQCFNLLAAGDIDAAMGDVVSAVEALTTRTDGVPIEEAPWLGMISTVHAIAYRDNAEGMAALASLDAGLADIKASGEWFSVIEDYLAAR